MIHVAGTLGVAANGWLVRGFLVSPLLSVKTHLLMLNLAITCLGRGLLAGFPFTATSTLAGRFVTPNGRDIWYFKYSGTYFCHVLSTKNDILYREIVFHFPYGSQHKP